MTDQDRIAALEAEVARLTALVDDLQPAFDLLKAVSARASDDLEAERAGTALLSSMVTTLTEQRDLAAAEAERMRAALKKVDELRVTHTSYFIVAAIRECQSAIAAPSTAAQVLSERDERVAGLAAGRERALVYRELREGALDGQLAEHDERVRRAALEEAAGLIQGAFVTLESGDLLTSDVKALLASGIRALAEVKP